MVSMCDREGSLRTMCAGQGGEESVRWSVPAAVKGGCVPCLLKEGSEPVVG